jgi:CMP-N-acetylneuraminic acid synthetase
MSTIALLPMKAHSERVSGKNFKNLAGKPLFRWILDALLAVDEIDQVVINTDARHILADNGLVDSDRILIRDRRPEICGDFVSMNLIIEDDLAATNADRYIMTHTTNPLLSSASIGKALMQYQDAKANGLADSLFGVTKSQTRFYKGDGSPINHDPNNLIRTQDLEPWYEENSTIYVFDKKSFAATKARIGTKPILFEIPKLEAIDIDEKEDWFLTNVVAKGLGEEENYA